MSHPISNNEPPHLQQLATQYPNNEQPHLQQLATQYPNNEPPIFNN